MSTQKITVEKEIKKRKSWSFDKAHTDKEVNEMINNINEEYKIFDKEKP